MAARITRIVLAAWSMLTLVAAAACGGNVGVPTLPPGYGQPPAAIPGALRTWSIARTGGQCFTRLMDCKRRFEEPGCGARRAVYPCPQDREGRPIRLSNSAALHGPLAGASCALYAYARDVPGYVRKGPARGPQSAKGARPNGKRWNPPPPVPPTPAACPQT